MRHRDFIIGVLLAASATTRKQATLGAGISTRGSDAVMAPICPQFGQTIRVSMNVTTAGRTRLPTPSAVMTDAAHHPAA
jgi:hypothetical protein